jgi:hypothetical protein
MREPLTPYSGHDRLNYLCIIVTEMLGVNTLADIPAIGSGFESIFGVLHPDVTRALKNLRIAGSYPATRRELQLMVDNYRLHHRQLDVKRAKGEPIEDMMPQRFIVHDDLSIERTWTTLEPDDVTEAIRSLSGILPIRTKSTPSVHDPMRAAEIRYETGYAGLVSPLGFLPPEPPRYEVERVGKAPGLVSWADLIEMANRFDAKDEEEGRQSPGERSWYHRLHDHDGKPTAVLMEPGDYGLTPSKGIRLEGLRHLIGLPGAGKTTLLYLLAAYLADKGYRACFLFPSIEVSTGFIEVLSRYDVDAGLLSGQSEMARGRHVLNFATSLSGRNHGFGVTKPTARFFATNCALAGFASDEEAPFPHGSPPCLQVLQKEEGKVRPRKHQCALSSVCGYQHAERSLTEASIWAGHIMSVDRRVSALYTEADIRHFEFLARAFDVLIIDEADGAQQALDVRGTPMLKLAGDSESLWSTLIRDLHDPAARGHNAFFAGMTIPSLLEMTGRFGRATERFIARVIHLPERMVNDRANNKANTLLTALSLISDMFEVDDEMDEEESKSHYDARLAFEILWDTAAKTVAFRLTPAIGDDEEDTDLDRALSEASRLCGASVEELRDYYQELVHAIENWDRDGSPTTLDALVDVVRRSPNLASPLDDELFHAHVALLVTVSLLVLQHFGLAPHLRLMNSMDLVSDNVFESRPSRDQLALLPESLVGRLSGVRYTISEEGNVDVTHVGFAGTPRCLPSRMIELGRERGGGMAILLTSATSLLEQSPSFHVDVGPHYVLKRPNAGSGWENSRYFFWPKRDPHTDKPLKFSGARMSQRERILKTMADQLLKGQMLSDVQSAINGNDVVDGVGRKVGFIVNSYEQCQLLYQHIQSEHPYWRGRVRYLAKPTLHDRVHEHAISAAEVEILGESRDWDILIFPMNAIGRGVNIVYKFGPRIDKAMLGSLFFLTRPHPRGDSLQLIQGLIGRASEKFDRQRFSNLDNAMKALKMTRNATTGMVEYLLRMQLSSQRLGEYAEPFVADQMIIILQTIGRAMRGDCPAFVYFVDAAWAPASARGEADSERTSMLVMMQSILKQCLTHPDPVMRECYENLYRAFSTPLNAIANLIKV